MPRSERSRAAAPGVIMARMRGCCLVLCAVLLGACGGGQHPAQAGAAADAPADDGITARSLLDQALAEARNWQPDAELVGVTTSLAEGPRHGFWFYDVQSPATSSCTRIRALANGLVENVGTGGRCVLMKPVGTGFVDSPAAWQAARAAGFSPGNSVQFGLRYQRDEALPEPRECWVLWSDHDVGETPATIRGWCVDPASGGFLVRLSGKGRTGRLE